jgi:hypothetical protein
MRHSHLRFRICCQKPITMCPPRKAITETNKIYLVPFGIYIRKMGPYLAAINRICISALHLVGAAQR